MSKRTLRPGTIEARKRWILDKDFVRKSRGPQHGSWLHLRGYHLGDMRCSQCDKWINPSKPEEAKEIKLTPTGRKVHDSRYCTKGGHGYGIARFSTTSRHMSEKRRIRLGGKEVKRY